MYISNKTERQYVTYFDKNYILKGISLIQSLQRLEVNFHIHVVCLDDETFKMLLSLNFPEVTPLRLKALENNNEALKKAREDRTLIEFYWTLTPFIIKQTLVKMPQDTVLTYVDSDLFFWSSPQAIFDDMGTASVYIHKHNFPDSLQHLCTHGTYNVGLLCFRHNEEGLKVLSWWQEKCFEWCRSFIDKDAEGRLRYGDQKYLEYFCSLTEELCVCSLPGAGVAPWNDIKFSLSKNEDGLPLVDGQPVIFYHHHSFQLITMSYMSPVGNSYQLPSACIEYFHIPYMCALEQSLTLLKKVYPSFSIGTPPDSALQRSHIIAHEELMSIFTQTGVKVLERFTVEGEKFLYFNLGVDAKKVTMQVIKPLSDVIDNYERFPQKPRLLNLGCGAHFHRSWLNMDIESSSKGVYTFDLRNEWSLPQNFFDVVYVSFLPKYMTKENIHIIIKRCYSILKPLGILRIATENFKKYILEDKIALEEMMHEDVLKHEALTAKQILCELDFKDIEFMGLQQSSIENFSSYGLEATEEHAQYKEEDCFIEARKLNAKDGCIPLPHIKYNIYRTSTCWDTYYPSFEQAQNAAQGYDAVDIFKRVYAAAKAVRDGEALWERDSVLFHQEIYNTALLDALFKVFEKDKKLNVLDFGGALGSTFVQHKKKLVALVENVSWNVVEQEHLVKCGKREFADEHLDFYFTCHELLTEKSINIALFSGVTQYLGAQLLQSTLDTLRQYRISHIIFDRTPLCNNEVLYSVEKPHAIYPNSSYAFTIDTIKNFNASLEKRGYCLQSSSLALDGSFTDCSFLCLHYRCIDL